MIHKLEENPQTGALSWLMEMELVSNPAVLNALIANIAGAVLGVKDVQFVIDTRSKKLLVYVKLSWFYDFFYKKATIDQVTELFEQVLPSFKKRVTLDIDILNKALVILNGKNSTKNKVGT